MQEASLSNFQRKRLPFAVAGMVIAQILSERIGFSESNFNEALMKFYFVPSFCIWRATCATKEVRLCVSKNAHVGGESKTWSQK